jgi:cytochrome c5
VFKLLCTHCHTLRGHLGIAQLVRGRTVAALDRVIDQLAQPVGPDGRPAPWSDPRLRMATWLGRRMPPFAGNAAERRAMAVYLARVGGTSDAGTGPESAEHLGERVYQDKCAICHDAGSDAPMARMIKGRSADALHAVIGRLHEISEAMPPFDGTDEERRALADFLAEGEAPRRGGEAGR